MKRFYFSFKICKNIVVTPLLIVVLSFFSTSSFAFESDAIAITNVRVFNGYGLSYPKPSLLKMERYPGNFFLLLARLLLMAGGKR